MKPKRIFFLVAISCLGCTSPNHADVDAHDFDPCQTTEGSWIECTSYECIGMYIGPEFIDGEDVAHQFSNAISAKVGEQLKSLYANENYSRVNFSEIEMSTEGMGSGNVIYKISIPFFPVLEKCEASTSFDHVGGWNHEPDLASRKKQLESAVMKGEKLDISELKTTAEGLQEYWFQWKNKLIQAECITQ